MSSGWNVLKYLDEYCSQGGENASAVQASYTPDTGLFGPVAINSYLYAHTLDDISVVTFTQLDISQGTLSSHELCVAMTEMHSMGHVGGSWEAFWLEQTMWCASRCTKTTGTSLIHFVQAQFG